MICFSFSEKKNRSFFFYFLGQKFQISKDLSYVFEVDVDMMKERFAKLLLGEDMSGSGKGVCTALAISNAITNLCGKFIRRKKIILCSSKCLNQKFKKCFFFLATIFGQLWRLEPLSIEKKEMWRREMEWILSVSDHIVELTPSTQTYPDGKKFEVCS